MLENEIAQFLDNPATTFSDISKKIKFAIAQQYLFDLGPDSCIEQKTAYDRATVANMLGVLGINDSKQLLATQVFPGVTVIQNEGQNIYHASGELVSDNVLKVVIDSMRKGVTEQKIKDKNDFNQINNIWLNIIYADYNNEKNKLGNKGQNYSYERFCLDNLKKRVYENIKSSVNSFDDVKANGVLNRKIKEDNSERTLWQKLKSDKSLFEASLDFCKKRLAIESNKNRDIEKELTLFDVLAVAGNEKAQIITFVQLRSLEQQVQKKNNPDYELRKENKIGNILGKKGRAEIKKETGTAPIV
ncbi:MAG: hypothetical protein MJ054_02010, partial [Clostridia bacterium]|nr:hypothetical protein [Clostridia bacterium]